MRRERGELPDDAFVVKSLVSTGLADAICASFGVEMRTVPTGFRFIAEQIDLAAKQHKGTFMFGFEESYGFLAGDFVHDKDAISTALLVCEAAIYCESKGSTLWNMLQEIYAKFGCYVEKTKSYTLAGREGMEHICRAMSDLRSKTPQQIDYPFVRGQVVHAPQPAGQDKAVMEIELTDETETIKLPPEIEIIKEVTRDRRYTNAALAKAIPAD